MIKINALGPEKQYNKLRHWQAADPGLIPAALQGLIPEHIARS